MQIPLMVADRRGPRQQRRRRIPQRQNHAVRHDRRTIRKFRAERLVPAEPRDVPNLAEDAQQPRVPGRRPLGLQQRVLQVVAIQRARQKILAVGMRHMALREAQKLQWIARVRRQPRRRHVEKIGEFAIGIGDAPAHGRAALDQHDVGRLPRRSAQQVGGQHRAAKAGADDDQGVAHR